MDKKTYDREMERIRLASKLLAGLYDGEANVLKAIADDLSYDGNETVNPDDLHDLVDGYEVLREKVAVFMRDARERKFGKKGGDGEAA